MIFPQAYVFVGSVSDAGGNQVWPGGADAGEHFKRAAERGAKELPPSLCATTGRQARAGTERAWSGCGTAWVMIRTTLGV